MGDIHYKRVPGADGGVDEVPGRPIGKPLDQILATGRPPWRVSLEILTAVCEIGDIAEEDGRVHGDVHTGAVFLDGQGHVSLAGFGSSDATATPALDRYGIGRIAAELLSTVDAPPAPGDPTSHERLVDRAVLGIRRDELAPDLYEDVVWYVHRLLSADPGARPTALQAWRAFVTMVDEVDGPGLETWAPAALDGGGPRRDLHDGEAPTTEQLRGPHKAPGPLAPGRSFEAPSAHEATLAWARPAPSPARTDARPRRRSPPEEETVLRPARHRRSTRRDLPAALAIGGVAAALFVGGGMLAVVVAIVVLTWGAT